MSLPLHNVLSDTTACSRVSDRVGVGEGEGVGGEVGSRFPLPLYETHWIKGLFVMAQKKTVITRTTLVTWMC